LLLSCGRSSERLTQVVGGVEATLEQERFPDAYVGHATHRTLTLKNQSRASARIELATNKPFSLPESVVELGGLDQEAVSIAFNPLHAGEQTGTLEASAHGEKITWTLSGLGATPPAEPCARFYFDASSEACVREPQPDGAACTAPCLLEGQCHAGVCRGSAPTCDDANACTADACSGDQGCSHQPVVCPPPAEPCRISTCDPTTGCAVTVAADGTGCGPADCERAFVCIAGQCEQRPVPEGAACGTDSPCQARGICRGKVCERPPAAVLVPAWSIGGTERSAASLALSSEGDVFWLDRDWTSFVPVLLASASWSGNQRPHQSLPPSTELTVTSDLILAIGHDQIVAFPLGGASAIWVRTPSEVLPGSQGFVSRGHALGTDQLYVAVFGPSPQAFKHAIAALDLATGLPKWVEDSAMPISMTVDEDGSLYVKTTGPSSLSSYRSDGTPRWTLPVEEFESVSGAYEGVLYTSEHYLRSAVTGAVLQQLPLSRTANSFTPSVKQQAVFRDGRGFALGYGPLSGDAVQLVAFDRSAGTAALAHHFDFQDEVFGAALLQDGGVITLWRSRVPAEAYVTAFESTGALGFTCRLKSERPRSFRLHGERLFVMSEIGLEAYDLPGVQAATSGWTSASGSPGNGRRAR
jgi:hypothetical protein